MNIVTRWNYNSQRHKAVQKLSSEGEVRTLINKKLILVINDYEYAFTKLETKIAQQYHLKSTSHLTLQKIVTQLQAAFPQEQCALERCTGNILEGSD